MEVLQRTANRGSISDGGYEIANSVKLEPDNSEYLKATNTFAYTTPTSNQKGTISFWIKRTEIGNNVSGKQMYIFASSSGNRYANLGFDEFDNLTVYSGDSSWNNVSPYTYNKFRDTSAWYHIVIRYDTTDSTASNRLRVYSNGTEVSWVVAPNITQNGAMTYSDMNGPTWHSWGTVESYFSPSNFFGGYLAEAHFVDGQSLAPTEFGEYDSTSGIWKPKEYDGTYGNCGYYLDFADSGNLGDDESGNGFDFDETNITAADQATDTPTNNFATMNPLWNYYNEVPRITVSDGGTRLTGNQSNTLWRGIPATIPVTAGKWYWEVERGYNGNGIMVGYGSTENIGWRELTTVPGSGSGKMMYSYNGDIYGYDSNEDNRTQYAGNFNTIGDIISIALDVDNGWAYTRYNGAAWHSSGNPSSGSTGTGAISIPWSPEEPTVFVVTIPNNAQDTRVNFGGYTTTANTLQYSDGNGYGAFKYQVPTGYYALCTKNLAEFG